MYVHQETRYTWIKDNDLMQKKRDRREEKEKEKIERESLCIRK